MHGTSAQCILTAQTRPNTFRRSCTCVCHRRHLPSSRMAKTDAHEQMHVHHKPHACLHLLAMQKRPSLLLFLIAATPNATSGESCSGRVFQWRGCINSTPPTTKFQSYGVAISSRHEVSLRRTPSMHTRHELRAHYVRASNSLVTTTEEAVTGPQHSACTRLGEDEQRRMMRSRRAHLIEQPVQARAPAAGACPTYTRASPGQRVTLANRATEVCAKYRRAYPNAHPFRFAAMQLQRPN